MARVLVLVALLLSIFSTLLCSYTAFGAVIGIDMGAENIVLSTPGITDLDATDFNTVEIVLNTQSHRKTANWIGFRNGERFFADDAMNLAARFPDLMTSAPHRFVGMLYNDTALQSYMKGQHFPYTIKPHPERGTVVFEYPNAGENGVTLSYTAEELLSMVFGHLKRTVEATTRHNEPVSGAVITVPHFFTERQRQAVIDAAALVGLRVIGLMHPTTAAALQYGIQNDGFGGEPTTVAIVDMGSGATHVAVYRYGGVETGIKKPRFNVGYGNLTTLALVSSSEVSGRVLDACVAKHIEDEFVAKTGLPRIRSGSTPQQRKAIISLMRAAKKVKETLTANRFALYTVEGMAPEKDFSSRMTREFFEENCAAEAAAEVGKLIDRALEKAGQRLEFVNSEGTVTDGKPLSSSAIDRVEVIGGGLRVLKLLGELQSHTGKSVGRTMNSDEAAAIGAGYRVASMGGVMRIKGFALQDPSALGQSVAFTVSPLASNNTDATPIAAPSFTTQPLFVAGGESYLPVRKVLSLGPLSGDGATVTLTYTLASASSAGEVKKDRAIEITGLKSALDTVKYFTDFQKENNATHNVKVELSISESGILSLDAASVDVSYAVNVTRTYKVPKNTSTPTPEGGDEGAASSKNSKSEAAAAEETKTVTTAKKRRRAFPLTTAVQFLRAPLPLSMEEARKSKQLLKKLDSRDEAALQLAATHNDLQSYLIWARGDGFSSYRQKLTADEKTALNTLLEETNTWVEDVATDSTTRQEVRGKLVVLRDEVRKLMKLTEDRPDAAASSGEDDDLFSSSPEPTAHSDDFIEDDGVRVKKNKQSQKGGGATNNTTKEGTAKREDGLSNTTGDDQSFDVSASDDELVDVTSHASEDEL